MMHEKILNFIRSTQFRRRIVPFETFQNEDELITLLYNYRVNNPGNNDLGMLIEDLFSCADRFIENPSYKERYYIRIAVLMFYRCRNNTIEKIDYDAAINTFKELKFLNKLENIHYTLIDLSCQQISRFRFMIENTQVAFVMRKMEVPKMGDIFEFAYYEDDEILDYLKHLFGIEQIVITHFRSQFFKFKVESIITRIIMEDDEDDEAEYIINVSPVI